MFLYVISSNDSIIKNYTDDTDTNTIQLTFNSIDMNKNILYELVSRYKNKDKKYFSPNDFLIPVYFAYIITVFNNTHSEYIYEKLHLIFLVIVTIQMYCIAFWEYNLFIQAKRIVKLLFSHDKDFDDFNFYLKLYQELLKKLNRMTPSLKKMTLLEASEIFYNEFMLPYFKNAYMQNMIIAWNNIPVVPNTHIQYFVLGNSNITSITNKFKDDDIFIFLRYFGNYKKHINEVSKSFDICKRNYGKYIVTDMMMSMYDGNGDFARHVVYYNKILGKMSNNNEHFNISFAELENHVKTKGNLINEAFIWGDKVMIFIPFVIHLQKMSDVNVETILKNEAEKSHVFLHHAYEKGLSQYMAVDKIMNKLYKADLTDDMGLWDLSNEIKYLSDNPYLNKKTMVDIKEDRYYIYYADIYNYINNKVKKDEIRNIERYEKLYLEDKGILNYHITY